MAELSIENMDKINIMLSEVALELLGNKFYDIYGNQHESLNAILTTDALAVRSKDYNERSCKLLNDLSVSIFDVHNSKSIIPNQSEPIRKRRASATEILDKTLPPKKERTTTTNDPESLLTPMISSKKLSGAARIGRRRFTCFDSSSVKPQKSPATRPEHGMTEFKLPAPKKSCTQRRTSISMQTTRTQSPLSFKMNDKKSVGSDKSNSRNQSPVECTPIGESIEETNKQKSDKDTMERVTALKAKAQEHYKQLLSESLKSRVEYFMTNRDLIGTPPYHSEYEIVQEYHNGEKDRLMYICNQLIEFIKFVKIDQEDSERMAFIANCILQLKDTM